MIDRIDETIAAVSSAAGSGPVGIVRLSGPEAIPIGDRLFHAKTGGPLSETPGFCRREGFLRFEDGFSLPASVYVFRAPRSYTRQDLVEIHSVGGAVALEMVRRECLRHGALPAQPGEFTARAFLSGAMDLASAEGVAALIRAESDAQLRASRRMMDGTLTRQLRSVTDSLTELVALVEADIDFAEEPIEFIRPAELRRRVGEVRSNLAGLMDEAVSAERLDTMPRVLLFGPPNAGKSSLMNRLTGTERSICAAVAGTTRDLLSAPMPLSAGEAMLLDSAGVDESADEILARARALTEKAAGSVDLLCVVIDLSEPPDPMVVERTKSLGVGRSITAANKIDLLSARESDERLRWWRAQGLGPVQPVSARTGEGVEALRKRFSEVLREGMSTVSADALLLTARQRGAIVQAVEALERVENLCGRARETADVADLLAFELREALDALGTVTGSITTEDLLSHIFRNFCIGK